VEHHKKNSKKKELEEIVRSYNNEQCLKESINAIRSSKGLAKTLVL
jgi:phosphopantothenate synthetase